MLGKRIVAMSLLVLSSRAWSAESSNPTTPNDNETTSERFSSYASEWLDEHDIGLSLGLLANVSRTKFRTERTPEVPRGCSAYSDAEMKCSVTTARGESSHASIAWDDRIIRSGLLYSNSGWSGGLHLSYSESIPELQEGDDAGRDIETYHSARVGGSYVYFARGGLTPQVLPDLLFTAYGGPILIYGATETPIGKLRYTYLGLRVGVEMNIIPFRFETSSIGLYTSADLHRPVLTVAGASSTIRDVQTSEAEVSVGLKALVGF